MTTDRKIQIREKKHLYRKDKAGELVNRLYDDLWFWLGLPNDAPKWHIQTNTPAQLIVEFRDLCATEKPGERIQFTCQLNANIVENDLCVTFWCDSETIRKVFASKIKKEWGKGRGVHNFVNGYVRAEYVISSI